MLKTLKILFVSSLGLVVHAITAQDCHGPQVILKMDDVRPASDGSFKGSWQRYIDTVRAYGINSALGVIWGGSEKNSKAYNDALINLHNSPEFELWHHGWDHSKADDRSDYEFQNRSYEEQKSHMERGMEAAKELGITLHTFGAPYNQTDQVTERVLNEDEDLKVWLYAPYSNNYGEMALVRGWRNKLESQTGVVSYESFLVAYEEAQNRPYLMLQGHPYKWRDEDFKEFELVITYLKAKEACFVLPYDYFLETPRPHEKTNLPSEKE